MHTLSLFPSLLTFGLFAPFLLRVAVGLLIVARGKERFSKAYKLTSIVYIVSGVLLIVGLYTQAAALVGFFILGFDNYADKKIAPLTQDRTLSHSLAAVVLISLLFTGAGFLAFDLPL